MSDLLTTLEAARYLNIEPEIFMHYQAQNAIDYILVNNNKRYYKNVLDTFQREVLDRKVI